MPYGFNTCFACPITCKRKVKATGRYEIDPIYGGPEYETAGALGSCCGIDDLEAIAFGGEHILSYTKRPTITDPLWPILAR
jgi:aldehyde:ferredoxin oxidoreductase